jgi:hypothetical protein
LALSPQHYKQHPPGSKVPTVLDKATSEARGKYLPSLREEFGEANVHCWAVVRVGLGTLLLEKIKR